MAFTSEIIRSMLTNKIAVLLVGFLVQNRRIGRHVGGNRDGKFLFGPIKLLIPIYLLVIHLYMYNP